jgi:hypothetical protein
MSNKETPESMREKVALLLLDKLVLAFVLAAVAYFFSLQLQNHQLIGQYQGSLFEKRLKSYKDLLKSAQSVRDEVLAFYSVDDRDIKNPSEDISARIRLGKARSRVSQIMHPTDSFGDIPWKTYEDILKVLEEMENTRKENSLYLSDTVNKAVDQFLSILWNDFEEDLQRSEKKTPDDPDFRNAAGLRIHDAYESLRKAILESLRVKEIVLG